MMGRQDRDQGQLFYEFKLDDVILKNHLLRRMNVFVTTVLADLHQQLKPFYSEIGCPSVDPELMIRMLIVGYCYGIRQTPSVRGSHLIEQNRQCDTPKCEYPPKRTPAWTMAAAAKRCLDREEKNQLLSRAAF
jgi:hypothetical protein